jgi:hypothetical protein
MPIQFDKFDQQKVDRLKIHLEAQAQKGHPKFYEIFVDNLKAVQKTDDPSEFEGYEDYMTSGTGQIKILIYNSGISPRNEQYVFSMKAKNPQEALEMGLDGVALMLTKNELSELKFNRDKQVAESQLVQQLNAEIEKLNAELQEQSNYVDLLEQGIEKAKANGNKIGGIDLGVILTEGLNGFVRKNTHLIGQIAGLDGIAKIIEQDTIQQQLPPAQQENAEVSFTKKTATNQSPVLSEDETHFLSFFTEIQKNCNEQEICEVIEILHRLSQDKNQIEPVIELLNQSGNEK